MNKRLLILSEPKLKALRFISAGCQVKGGNNGGKMFGWLARILVRDGLVLGSSPKDFRPTTSGKLVLQLWSQLSSEASKRKYAAKSKNADLL